MATKMEYMQRNTKILIVHKQASWKGSGGSRIAGACVTIVDMGLNCAHEFIP